MSDNILMYQEISNYMKIKQLDEFMIGHKGYIAGGVFKNIFNDEKVKDIDVFFEKQADYEEAVEYFKKSDDYKEGYKNDKVTSFLHKDRGVLVELIKHKFRKPIEMIEEFDFTVTKFVYYKQIIQGEDDEEDTIEWKLAFHNRFFEHLHLKRLVIDEGIILPVNTYNRMFKYAKYGYFPCRETKVKVIEALRNLPAFSEEMIALGLYDGLD